MYNILIVDDREIFRRQFKRLPVFRNNSSFQVGFEAQNGKEALDILREQQVDILVTDIRMPIMDGLELLKIVKEEKLCTCIVLLSEHTDFTYAKQGIVLGAFDYIVKPIENHELEKLLKRCNIYLASLERRQYSSSKLGILPALLLRNDDYVEMVSHQIAKGIVEGENSTVPEILMEFEIILSEIRKKISEESPHMELYCNFADLFSFDKSTAKEDMEDHFCRIIFRIQKEINKFSVNSKNELIQSVCNTIIKNVENDLSLQSIANLYQVNKAYLSHLFKQELGMSFVDYLTIVKMERAKKLLTHSSDKVYIISQKLGYSDTEYFSKLFKKYTGYTATEYRQFREG